MKFRRVVPFLRSRPGESDLVIETGGRHVSLVGDETSFIASHHGLSCMGEPDFSSCGRYVYLDSRDGSITKFKLVSVCVLD